MHTSKRLKYPSNWEAIILNFNKQDIEKNFFNESYNEVDVAIGMVGELLDALVLSRGNCSVFLTNFPIVITSVDTLVTAVCKLRSLSAHVQGCNLAWFEFPKYNHGSNAGSKKSSAGIIGCCTHGMLCAPIFVNCQSLEQQVMRHHAWSISGCVSRI